MQRSPACSTCGTGLTPSFSSLLVHVRITSITMRSQIATASLTEIVPLPSSSA